MSSSGTMAPSMSPAGDVARDPFLDPDGEPVAQLRHTLVGDMYLPGEDGYEHHRRVYNGQIDRRPAAIVVAGTQSDVQDAVRFAGRAGLPVAVRGGGHSVAGHGTCDGGVLVDLRRLRGVHVDPQARQVWVQGGATLRELDAQTQAYGLAVPTGQVSATGIAGLALGGGLGMLQRRFGLTCDNLVGARLVDASGEIVHVDEQSRPELLWALRGGGGNFGVVTDFLFRAHEVPTTMLAGLVAWPIERSAEILAHLDDLMVDAPLELSADIIYQFAPPLAIMPPEILGTHLVGIFVRWSGEPEAGEAVVERIRSVPGTVLDLVAPMPFVEVQRLLDPLNPDGHQHRWTGEFLPGMEAAERDALTELGRSLPNPMCIIEVIPYNGRVLDVAAADTAFVHRSPGWLIHVLGQWADPADEAAVLAWVDRAKRLLGDVSESGRTYLNLVGDEESAGRVDAFWSGERGERLRRVKRRYDPDNVFRFNHNISPETAPGSDR